MLEPGELGDKFRRLTRRALGERGAAALCERLQRLEGEENLTGSERSRASGQNQTFESTPCLQGQSAGATMPQSSAMRPFSKR